MAANNLLDAYEQLFPRYQYKVNGYDLRMMSDLQGKDPTKKGELYLELTENRIEYKVLGENKEVITGKILNSDLHGVVMPERNDLSEFNKMLKCNNFEKMSP
jgi:hypothetical protein